MNRSLLVAAIAGGCVALISAGESHGETPATKADPAATGSTENSTRQERMRYDAVGRLIRNKPADGKASKSNSPPYVLIDKTGKPRCYITPDEGVDVADLVNLRVGVRGAVRAIEGDRLPHLLARGVRKVADAPAVANPTTNADKGVIAAANTEPLNEEEIPSPQPDAAMQGSEVIDGGEMAPQGMRGAADDGAVYYDGNDGAMGGDVAWQGVPACGDCGGMSCGQCVACCRANDPGVWWVRGEYLLWSTSGMQIPALVTTSPNGTARADAGVLGETGTRVIFGNEEVNDGLRSGGRIQFGRWLDPEQKWGASGEFFGLSNETTSFSATSSGSPILARPFFDADAGQQSAELVAFPNVISGTVDARATTGFQGAGALLRYNICCRNFCWRECCCFDCCKQPAVHPAAVRVGVIGGYRFMKLDDSVRITEDLTTLDEETEGSFLLQDQFRSSNKFNGAELGFVVDLRKSRWTLELLSKVAIGNNRELVRINGTSSITEDGATENFTGGLLAQRTNIGTYTRDQFTMIPQLGATLGYNVSPRLRFTAGYTLIYWGAVARAGDQISLDVNPNLIPPEANPFTGPLRPAFTWRDTDFWAQGINLGVDYRF